MLVIHTMLDRSAVIVYAESDSAGNHSNKNGDMSGTTSDRQFCAAPQKEHAARIKLDMSGKCLDTHVSSNYCTKRFKCL